MGQQQMGKWHKKDIEKAVDEVFDKCDANHTGRLDWNEMENFTKYLAKKMGVHYKPSMNFKITKLLDEGNGLVSKDELKEGWKKLVEECDLSSPDSSDSG